MSVEGGGGELYPTPRIVLFVPQSVPDSCSFERGPHGTPPFVCPFVRPQEKSDHHWTTANPSNHILDES